MRATRLVMGAAMMATAAMMSVACGSKPAEAPTEKITPTVTGEMSPEEAGGMRPEDASTEPAATAPHGGTVVALGTSGNLEFVLDPSSGLLTAYILDADARAVMRIPAKAIALEVTAPGGKAVPLVLDSTANGFTGDTVGNSSQFGGTAASLKGVTSFSGVVKEATVGGQAFKDIAFTYPSTAAH